jgi:hypothetical protein
MLKDALLSSRSEFILFGHSKYENVNGPIGALGLKIPVE